MKVDILDAHDRLTHLTKQEFSIAECCQDLINQKPYGDHPFYIFYHTRTDDDGINKRGVWQPRLLKPKPQTNSMLFKAYPGSDEVKIIWMIPQQELWAQYNKGMLCENELIANSIYDYLYNRRKLGQPEEDDLSPQDAQRVLFEYQPQLFKRETLPKELQPIWDIKMKKIQEDKKQANLS